MISQWRLTVAVAVGMSSVAVPLQGQSANDAAWAALTRDVEARDAELGASIELAKGKELTTDYAEVSQQVIRTFQAAARHDRERVGQVRRIFGTFRWKAKVDTNAAADRLATDELRACLEVADHAIRELRRQLKGEITLSASPDFSKGRVTLGLGSYRLDGRPVFPSSLVWLPDDEGLMSAFGRLGGGFHQLTNLRPDGTVDPGRVKAAAASTRRQVQANAAPLVYLLGHAPAGWMKTGHPEILHGARNFTQYDIDSPLVREWIANLCAGTLPALSEAAGDRPMMHLLANEPHFATVRGGWLARNGVSELTRRNYREWMAAKYRTIEALNRAHGTSYRTFAAVEVALPIDPSLRGGPVWYDWCRFNMDRVNDWFTFLKRTAQENDPKHSPVSIKTLGHTLGNPARDHGMDIEYLTQLQDVPGSDLRVVPRGATFYGKNEDGLDTSTGWGHRYAYLWVDQCMVLDFTKSLCPDKVFYDSEWHGFGTVGWRHYHLNREYVRSALWLAFTHGMGAINPWVWGRDSDGVLSPKTEHIGELSTQPVALDAYGRVMKELNSRAQHVVAAVPKERRVLIHYCEEAAIQSEEYIEQLQQVYEALKLNNIPLGFTTPSEIGRLSPETQTVIVSPTPHIAEASLRGLQSFQRAGGRMVLVGAERSFLKTELGAPRPDHLAKTGFASLPLADVSQMALALETVLAPVIPQMPIEISITDEAGHKAYGVIVSPSLHAQTGEWSMVLNNVSKEPRLVTLTRRGEPTGTFLDLLTGRREDARIRMEPCGVRLLVAAGPAR